MLPVTGDPPDSISGIVLDTIHCVANARMWVVGTAERDFRQTREFLYICSSFWSSRFFARVQYQLVSHRSPLCGHDGNQIQHPRSTIHDTSRGFQQYFFDLFHIGDPRVTQTYLEMWSAYTLPWYRLCSQSRLPSVAW